MTNTALLSSYGDYTVFSFNRHVIRFRTSPHLVRYTEIKEWNAGYIVCLAKYDNSDVVEEEYIDLIPILQNLYFDVSGFLEPIKNVKISYE